MTQKSVTLTFPDGSLIAVMQPAGCVGYAQVDLGVPGVVGVVFRCYVEGDSSPAAAFGQAVADLPAEAGFKWLETANYWNARESMRGVSKYVPLELAIDTETEGRPIIKVTGSDPESTDLTESLYTRIKETGPVAVRGMSALSEALAWLKRQEAAAAELRRRQNATAKSGSVAPR